MSTYDPNAVKQRYGRLPKSDQEVLNYAKAVKIVAGADGELPQSEQQALARGLDRLGASDEVKKQVDAFDFRGAKLEDCLGDITKGGVRAKALLRDAIEISRADGVYSKEERASAAKAADLLGVDRGTLAAIESLVELEHAVAHLRKGLFPKKG